MPVASTFAPMIKLCEVERISVPGISREVQFVFTTARLHYIYDDLLKIITKQELSAFMKRCWEEERQLLCQCKGSNFFLFYAQRVLNPVLNRRLNRPQDHPTLNNLISYSLRQAIANTVDCKEFIKEEPRNPLFKTYPVEVRCN